MVGGTVGQQLAGVQGGAGGEESRRSLRGTSTCICSFLATSSDTFQAGAPVCGCARSLQGTMGRTWDLPLPALPMTKTECRTCSSSSSCTTFSTKLSSACSRSSSMLCLMIWGCGQGQGAKTGLSFVVGVGGFLHSEGDDRCLRWGPACKLCFQGCLSSHFWESPSQLLCDCQQGGWGWQGERDRWWPLRAFVCGSLGPMELTTDPDVGLTS